jgi:uncharacterized membrane protein YphA (DoxX/SURF4 family)
MAGASKWAQYLDRSDFGLLLLRIFMALFLVTRGVDGFMGGFLALRRIGWAAGTLGFPLSPALWGALACFCFIGCGLFVLLGFLFRLSVAILLITQVIHVMPQFSWKIFVSPPFDSSLILLVVCLGLLFIGPGKYSVRR